MVNEKWGLHRDLHPLVQAVLADWRQRRQEERQERLATLREIRVKRIAKQRKEDARLDELLKTGALWWDEEGFLRGEGLARLEVVERCADYLDPPCRHEYRVERWDGEGWTWENGPGARDLGEALALAREMVERRGDGEAAWSGMLEIGEGDDWLLWVEYGHKNGEQRMIGALAALAYYVRAQVPRLGRCAVCAFWVQVGQAGPDMMGECRRHSPVLREAGEGSGPGVGVFPLTSSQAGCGEFRPREDVPS